jgi:tetratricopeptide (TPR) repeat protein
MKRAVAVLLLCLTACVAHEKNGDKAAAAGDWKTAVAAYREALVSEPDSPALKQKYEQAREEAVADASRRARSCAGARDWQCAVSEADYALGLDTSSPELAAFRADAARSLAREQLQRARTMAGGQQFVEALDMLQRATAVSHDAEILQDASRARAEVVGLADTEAERLRQLKAYPRALTLLRLVVQSDPSRQQKLAAMEAEYDQFQMAEYERLAREGDVALAQRRFAEAQEKYEEALRMKAGGRAEPLARYAGGLAQADKAMSRRDFVAAAEGYRRAVDSGLDRDGQAAARLAQVEIRPYALRIESVLLRLARPDGRPWVGPPSPLFGRMLDKGADLASGSNDAARRLLIRAAERVPAQNRPSVSVIVTLPDGERLMTPMRSGPYAVFDDPELVVATNHFDERKVVFHVVAQAAGTALEELGVVEVALGELVQRGESELSRQSIAALELAAGPAGNRVEGMFSGLRPVSDGGNLAQDFSMPTPRTRGFRLTGVHTVVRPGDYVDEQGQDGAPDLYVELEQGGRVVYRGPVVSNHYDSSWSPVGVSLHVEKDEQLIVRVWDMDEADAPDLVLNAYVPAHDLSLGRFRASSPGGGSSVELRFEPRRSGTPQVAATRP